MGELYRWAVAEQAPEVVDFEALDVREPEEVAPEGEEPLDWVETLEAAEALGFELDGESYWVYQGGAQAMCCGGRTMGLEAGSLGEAGSDGGREAGSELPRSRCWSEPARGSTPAACADATKPSPPHSTWRACAQKIAEQTPATHRSSVGGHRLPPAPAWHAA